jgi:hypothetical protein
MVRAALIVVLLAAASGVWWLATRRAARFRPPPRAGRANTSETRLTAADLSQELGACATFVQFSSATCATCPQVRRVLTQLAASEPGVAYIDIQSEDHMDLVRQLSIYRTPTVLLLNPGGELHTRTSGPLTPARAQAALADLRLATTRSIDA